MDLRIADRVRCPLCRGKLTCKAFVAEDVSFPATSSQPAETRPVVKEGVFLCDACRTWYPIAAYVPVMLPFASAMTESFAKARANDMSAIAGYHPPTGKPRPGELFVQETFSDQWDLVQDDDLTFYYTSDDLVALHRESWLNWLPKQNAKVRTVFNVGIGLGAETQAVQEALGGDVEMFGIDLNFAVLQSGAKLKARPGMHIFVASLFSPPFAEESFDLVYTQGVIHHTYSTRAAFDSIARFVRPDGLMFVWVYGLDDHLVPKGILGLLARIRVALEIFRPVVAVMPKFLRNAFFFVLTLILHPAIKSRGLEGREWTRTNTDHALRDWISPRYAYRHSFNELLEWYEELGFDVVGVQSPHAYRRRFKKRLAGVGVAGRRAATAVV
jgi:SAM-dependent methyltransferase/uncharacterized protein YbaR (Trm112 family)